MKTKLLAALATSLLLTAGAVSMAQAVECKQGQNRAGCVGANGAVYAGPNGAGAAGKNGVYTTNQGNSDAYHPPAPGTSVTGARGNTATKAWQSGCVWVNGQRKCN
ncbi:MAG: hypothetical protein U1E53_08345 [Dongiaceae bacterium]